ncbi:hypothetical protein T484DRAFT_1894395 [Baffinella frigidus]|nr:hypothetical protein T484DRAFT_1894395 [Cryptophyta sp. CCMP2293]
MDHGKAGRSWNHGGREGGGGMGTGGMLGEGIMAALYQEAHTRGVEVTFGVTPMCGEHRACLHRAGAGGRNVGVGGRKPGGRKRGFWGAYDAAVCVRPASGCEVPLAMGLPSLIYLEPPFVPIAMGLPSLIYLEGRLERGRESLEGWARLLLTIQTGAAINRTLLAAGSAYLAEYAWFFTGVRPILARAYLAEYAWFFTGVRPILTRPSLEPLLPPPDTNGTWFSGSCMKVV